jgi:serine protease Do
MMSRFSPALTTLPLLLLVALLVFSGSLASAQERPQQAWLGVLLDRAADAAGDDDPALPRGAVVRRIIEGSPADDAGLRARDRIVQVDGVAVNSGGELISLVRGMAPDTWVSIAYTRKGRERNASVRLSSRPRSVRGLRVREGWIGASAIELPASLREHFGAPSEAGVMISNVEPGSPAEVAGLSLGDVVHEVEGETVASTGEFERLVQGGGVGNELEITLARNGAEITVEATVSLQPESP